MPVCTWSQLVQIHTYSFVNTLNEFSAQNSYTSILLTLMWFCITFKILLTRRSRFSNCPRSRYAYEVVKERKEEGEITSTKVKQQEGRDPKM